MLIREFGGPDLFELADVPTPDPGPGEIRVKVAAAGINFTEIMQRSGNYPGPATQLPAVLGSEAVGIVDALGPNTDGPAVGTRVAAPLFASMKLTGSYAEYVTIPAAYAVPLPDDLAFKQALALMVQGTTAWLMLREIPPAGRRVLVKAAAGGVGTVLVQLAKVRGAASVTGAASASKLQAVRGFGADLALDYGVEDWDSALSDGAGDHLRRDGGSHCPQTCRQAGLRWHLCHLRRARRRNTDARPRGNGRCDLCQPVHKGLCQLRLS